MTAAVAPCIFRYEGITGKMIYEEAVSEACLDEARAPKLHRGRRPYLRANHRSSVVANLMKKVYRKPVLVKREKLSAITADTAPSLIKD